VLFVFTKMVLGYWPTTDWLAKVIALEFQVAAGRNCGWLNEWAKGEKQRNWDDSY
jgi:hypothetical protein